MTDNDRGVARESLARFLIRMQRYDEGVDELKTAAGLLPDSAETQYFYGVALNSLGRFPEALPYLEKARELAPRHLEYLIGLATVCRDAGKGDLALRYAREALALEPDNPQLQQLVTSLGG
jgi:tetratricopeptide (TPR) repeat protein